MKRILWLCTHRAQWKEELSLLLDAGFEVVPARLTHRLAPGGENPDDPSYPHDWRQRCSLPADLVDRLRAVNWFHEAPPAMVGLAREVFDGILVSRFPDSLLLVARWFDKRIFFRVFGHAGLNTYSNLLGRQGLRELSRSAPFRGDNYHWCPILSTLAAAEDPRFTRGEVFLGPVLSADRLPARWHRDSCRPYIAVVLSKIVEVPYYNQFYQRIAARFRTGPSPVPLRFLGQNLPGGGALGDPEIVGALPDVDYYRALAEASAFFYQGNSIFHLHWSPLEALAIQVPVVMLSSSYLALWLRELVGPVGAGHGVVEGLDEARKLLSQCLADPQMGADIAERQDPLARQVTDRPAAIAEYRRRLLAA